MPCPATDTTGMGSRTSCLLWAAFGSRRTLHGLPDCDLRLFAASHNYKISHGIHPHLGRKQLAAAVHFCLRFLYAAWETHCDLRLYISKIRKTFRRMHHPFGTKQLAAAVHLSLRLQHAASHPILICAKDPSRLCKAALWPYNTCQSTLNASKT